MEIYTTPTREEFFEYAQQHGWADWAEDLWKGINRTNWLKNNGTIPKYWQTIVNVRNGALMNKLGVSINKNIDVYTDSQYCILVLSKTKAPKKNQELFELYQKCANKLAEVRFHWVKGHNGNKI